MIILTMFDLFSDLNHLKIAIIHNRHTPALFHQHRNEFFLPFNKNLMTSVMRITIFGSGN